MEWMIRSRNSHLSQDWPLVNGRCKYAYFSISSTCIFLLLRPITGIVFACDSFDSETKQIAVLLEDGKFITVRITEKAWHSTWMSIAGLGKVRFIVLNICFISSYQTIEFTGDVTSSIAGTLIVTAGAAPTCLNNKPVHFIRSATPNSDEISCT